MKLAVISHKLCWETDNSPTGYATDGGFPLQMAAISELFDETRLLVPCEKSKSPSGLSSLNGDNLTVAALSAPTGSGFARKLAMPFWFIRNGWKIGREVWRADAVHAPIPGDVGTIGMFIAMLMRKPLFVRHCGNWMVQRTAAERFWKSSMERFAGGQNVMLATGGSDALPSSVNANIKWIFSTSLRDREIRNAAPKHIDANSRLKLITACRLEKRKGVEITIESLSLILQRFPTASLDVVGDGAMLDELNELAEKLGLSERVVFHGKVEHSRVIDLMKEADVFCFPTSASEGFPKVVLEAMACGLPVVTTRVSVLPQLIGNNCGILIDQPSAEAAADAITHICSDAGLYNKMSANAIAMAQHYTLENWRDFIGKTLRASWKVESLSSAPLSRQEELVV